MNNVTYRGVVTVEVNDTTVKLTNSGTKELGLLITKALAGYNIADDIPRYLNIQIYEGKDRNNNDIWTNLLNRNLPFTGIRYLNKNEIPNTNDCIGSLKFNCIVLYTNKLQPYVQNNSTLRLCMLNSIGDILAQVYTTKKDGDDFTLSQLFNDIVEGTDCIVDWEMSFYNKETQPEGE